MATMNKSTHTDRLTEMLRPIREAAAVAASARRAFLTSLQASIWPETSEGEIYIEQLPIGNPSKITSVDFVAEWAREDQRGISYRVLTVVNTLDHSIVTMVPTMGGSAIRCASGVLKRIER